VQQTDGCRPQGNEALLMIFFPLYTQSGHLENLYLDVKYAFEKHTCHYRLFFSCGALPGLIRKPKDIRETVTNFFALRT
jgi:hypothetical protein